MNGIPWYHLLRHINYGSNLLCKSVSAHWLSCFLGYFFIQNGMPALWFIRQLAVWPCTRMLCCVLPVLAFFSAFWPSAALTLGHRSQLQPTELRAGEPWIELYAAVNVGQLSVSVLSGMTLLRPGSKNLSFLTISLKEKRLSCCGKCVDLVKSRLWGKWKLLSILALSGRDSNCHLMQVHCRGVLTDLWRSFFNAFLQRLGS